VGKKDFFPLTQEKEIGYDQKDSSSSHSGGESENKGDCPHKTIGSFA